MRLPGLPSRFHGPKQVIETERQIAPAPRAAIVASVKLPAAVKRLPRPFGARTQGPQMIEHPPQFRHFGRLGRHVKLADGRYSVRLEDANHERVQRHRKFSSGGMFLTGNQVGRTARIGIESDMDLARAACG